jgi:hypothetical protein
MTPDIQKSILRACARFLRKQIEPIEKRLLDMETKALEPELSGIVSKFMSTEETKARLDLDVSAAVAKHLLANPIREGKDADPVEVFEVVSELLVADELKTLVDLHVAESVARYFEENPVKHGKDADPIADDQIGAHVAAYLAKNPPEKGDDGKSVTADDVKGLVELEVMKGLRDLERHAGEVIQRAADAIPKPRDGIDGRDLTGAEIDYDGERGLIIRNNGLEIVKKMPLPIDRGYWREGFVAEKGDVVTTEGSAWIALKDNSVKPSLDNKDSWRMLARKGKDGDKGDKGSPYVPPQPVKLNG